MMSSLSMQSSDPQDITSPEPPKSGNACLSCKKQKRKCDKLLPACSLCKRMSRPCDYTDTRGNPNDDITTLQRQVLELTARIDAAAAGGSGFGVAGMRSNGRASLSGASMSSGFNDATPATSVAPSDVPMGGIVEGYAPQSQFLMPVVQNRFPAIAFLDSDTFKHGGIVIPKPSIDIPEDVLGFLGNGSSVQAILTNYFATVHKWFPIISQKRLTRNFENPLYEAGPDLALLFLTMKLVSTTPPADIEPPSLPIYLTCKRFLYHSEASGAISLLVLQAGLLIAWYEYGQAIYPAAFMTAGWCIRYGNVLGINGNSASCELLGRPNTWTEQEERRRTWWGVLITDKKISLGSQGHILTTQDPTEDSPLPVNDDAWDSGDMASAVHFKVSTPLSTPVGPFHRLCQSSLLLSKVQTHHHGTVFPSDSSRFANATRIYVEVQALILSLSSSSSTTSCPTDELALSAPLALSFSTLCALCDPYSCPEGGSANNSSEAVEMISKAIHGLRTAADSVVLFASRLNTLTCPPPEPSRQNWADRPSLNNISPIVMDAIYSAAANFAWLVRESGSDEELRKLNVLRDCLRRFARRWRSAGEYLRILEAQEFTFAIGGCGAGFGKGDAMAFA